jgi:hypothetical protein
VKAFLSFTPVEGGTNIRIRTWYDERVRRSWWKQWIAWLMAGIAASQLQYDVRILKNRIRPRKPIIQPPDGPFNRVNTWLKQFYSESSQAASSPTCGYNNDW